MPLNVRKLFLSVLLVFVSSVLISHAQSISQSSAITPPAPTSGDVMRERISKAKAFIVVRNYNAAIYELENIHRETSDTAVQSVVNVLLMNSYLEQGDFKRAQDFLNLFYNEQKTTKPNASAFYMSVAGQIVKGARSRADRYRALGLSVADRTLPLEAANDLEKMRETLEMVITQAIEIGKDARKTADAMAMIEEASASRSMIARDDYDARRWQDSVAAAREEMMSSGRVVVDAVNEPSSGPVNGNNVAADIKPVVMQPVADNKPTTTREREVITVDTKPADSITDKNDKPEFVPAAPAAVKIDEPKSTSPLDVGSLVGYATRQTSPVYPPAAKSTRTTGIVKVEFTVDEKGEVTDVQKTSGPPMLQAAAKDAIRKWKFKPFVRDGQPVKATGFVSFNFAL